MKASILEKTHNFIELYQHHLGESEVPEAFHDWSCLALMAACVADRVWLEKFRGSRLAPNLYVFLVGPSGLGKGQAIDEAMKFTTGLKRLNVYRGKTTAQYLLDFLGRPDKASNVVAHSKVWLITPELAMSVGEGGQATTFIKHMTDLYTGTDHIIREGTRTRGGVLITKHCVNWLAGTTRDWLIETVPKSAVTGGFFARAVAVDAKYDFTRRFRRPRYPHDYDEVVAHLQERVLELSYIEGVFRITEEAESIEEAWYQHREAPQDEALFASWKREHDLTLKLAMLFSLADDLDLVIDRHHMVAAQRAAGQVMRSMPDLVSAASTTTETVGIELVESLIKQRKAIAHSGLVAACYKRGVHGDRLKAIIETLMQARKIARYQSPMGGWAYAWGGQRKLDSKEGEAD